MRWKITTLLSRLDNIWRTPMLKARADEAAADDAAYGQEDLIEDLSGASEAVSEPIEPADWF